MAAKRSATEAVVSERYPASRGRVRRLLGDITECGRVAGTLYLRPESTTAPLKVGGSGFPASEWVSEVVRQVGYSETGAAVFWDDDRAWAVLPPFPVEEDLLATGVDGTDLLAVYERRMVVGVVLLRMGRYAIGVLRDDELLASKTDTRHVKRRHRAGGSSQRRFMRSRDRLIRELYDEACEVTRRVFEPHVDGIDCVLTGGERQTVNGFLKRCVFFEKSGLRVMSRLLAVDRPSHKALEGIHREVWKSRVLVFDKVE